MTGKKLLLRGGDDSGVAMVMVIALGFVLSILVAAALTSSTNDIRSSRRSQDFHQAAQAAQAGVDDYLYQLNVDGNYYTKGNTDPANPALSTTTWQQVPG